MIVPEADFFPASVFNYSRFNNFTGYPVQAFRGLSVIAITWFVIMSLDVFDVREKRMLVDEVGKSIVEREQIEEEREAIARQLLQSQKMEAIGQLAGGMAHDFNNMLTVIMGNANLALTEVEDGDPGHVEFKEIMNASERARDMTMKLLTFARKEKIDVRTIKISRLLNELKAMLERTFPKKIKIKTELREDLPVSVDATQIQQALLNICNNSRDAMPDGGTLTIECADTILDDEQRGKYADVKPGCYCVIQISDTGHGIPKEMLQKVIEPFFTTKGPGKGTGLGLSVTFGIIKSHNGMIRICSEQGQGTTVKVYLPVADDAEREEKKEVADEIRRGDETILLVDDEKPVLDIAGRLLAKVGYTVIAADGGSKAVELYRNRSKEIALVVLDMIMPEMDGGDVYRALREINPDVKVVLSSGYSINGQAGKLMTEGIRSFVQKPFTMSALCGTIRHVLDE
ncbi:MAG: ATP-binding protein [bacterium]